MKRSLVGIMLVLLFQATVPAADPPKGFLDDLFTWMKIDSSQKKNLMAGQIIAIDSGERADQEGQGDVSSGKTFNLRGDTK
jgi:hypothetical protein